MAKALKCDRCGGFFDYIKALRRYQIRDMDEKNFDKTVDLCPECYGKLVDFLEEESDKLAPNVYTCVSDKAREMAIQALSQKPCDDAISRQYIIDIYKSCADMLSDEELKGADLVMEWVNNAPSVTQKS